MATYKVPQDVEAEDKLIGFVTFKQFLYLIVATLFGFLTYMLFQITPLLSALALPFLTIFLLLGLWRREDQPIETYFLAFLNFVIKPRKRLWKPESAHQNIKITAPKKAPPQVEASATEAKSQLKKLAQIVDTRGWSSKRPELSEGYSARIGADDRLAMPNSTYEQEPLEIHDNDDMFAHGKTAQNLEELALHYTRNTKQEAIKKMKSALSNRPSEEAATPPIQPERTDESAQPAVVPQTEASPEHSKAQAFSTPKETDVILDASVDSSKQPAESKPDEDDSGNIQEGQEVSLR